jgi:hypothetical protein
MQTNYEFTKARSSYHYDTTLMDPRWDCARGLGKFQGNWEEYIPEAIKQSKIINWANKRYSPTAGPSTRVDLEVNDLIQAGVDPERQICYRVIYDVTPFPKWKKIVDMIGYDRCMGKVQIQLTGDCMNVHVDKMDEHFKDVPESDWDTIGRTMVMLTDWQPGQFMSYGNYVHSHWRAGEIHDFAWQHVPHGTANASLTPRLMMTVSGIKTAKSEAFFKMAADAKYIPIE